MQNLRKNQWLVSEIFKDRQKEQQTDKQTNKGNYCEPHRVNNESKMALSLSTKGKFIKQIREAYDLRNHEWYLEQNPIKLELWKSINIHLSEIFSASNM